MEFTIEMELLALIYGLIYIALWLICEQADREKGEFMGSNL